MKKWQKLAYIWLSVWCLLLVISFGYLFASFNSPVSGMPKDWRLLFSVLTGTAFSLAMRYELLMRCGELQYHAMDKRLRLAFFIANFIFGFAAHP